ncbi:hypothetical protein [Paenibacillus sp. P32E]|uniref:hypothetical protein n=1 Tax=Paenibacillus sp. P32E TaxID=1349434 RepID=UPI00093BF93F|nr:hypothetical protein [Paenibacillus sp. P32E]OKP89121.1 hypothetical protein A3848_16595 [Paenibacillus sp. P32E]
MLRADGFDELLGNLELPAIICLLSEEAKGLYYNSEFGKRTMPEKTKDIHQCLHTTGHGSEKSYLLFIDYMDGFDLPLYLSSPQAVRDQIKIENREEGSYFWQEGIFWALLRNKRVYMQANRNIELRPIIQKFLKLMN